MYTSFFSNQMFLCLGLSLWERISWLNYFQIDSRLRGCSLRLISPVHEATVLEVITVSPDLQLPAGEAFTLVEGDLKGKKTKRDEEGWGWALRE